MTNEYDDFIASKKRIHKPTGMTVALEELHPKLFEWQKHIVKWALSKGKACLFEDCGLGKTFQSLEFAKHVPGDVLIVAPLQVSAQTLKEANRFGYDAGISRDGKHAHKITITNYEMFSRFDMREFGGIVLDESSILKSQTGKMRTAILEETCMVPYRLACTATPSPNDLPELLNHAIFVGACTVSDGLATWFVHDGGETQKWRLKGHAKSDFWQWVTTWVMMIRTPQDIGFPSDDYHIPPMSTHEHVLNASTFDEFGSLFAMPASGLQESNKARNESMPERAAKTAEIVNASSEQWVVWCERNPESTLLTKLIPDAMEIAGSHDIDTKEKRIAGFIDGSIRVLVTKTKIAGFGLNWQHCHNTAFAGLSDSFESYYQAIRRFHRFGQTKTVNVHIVSTDTLARTLDNIKRKRSMHDDMAKEMVGYMKEHSMAEITGITAGDISEPMLPMASGEGWKLHHGDCVDVMRTIPDNSIHYSVFSPPFASLYQYSASDKDLGNCTDHETFHKHHAFMIRELHRIMMPGRLVSFHCMDLPTSKVRDGFIGLIDFRGRLITEFEKAGFVLASQVCIWKDPVTAMTRTKALGLLYKTLRRDSSMSRQGIPDYLVTMRKLGENPEPITHTPENFPCSPDWQQYASPIWADIKPNDTLQYRSARENEDERHICPLQLGVIHRAMRLWSNPGDTVFSPFTGIGSEGYQALKDGRKFLGVELKNSYFKQAAANLDIETRQGNLFYNNEPDLCEVVK